MSAVDYLEVIAEPSGATDNSRLQICAGPSDPNSARLPLPTRVFSKMSTKSCSTRNLKIAFAVILISFFIGTALLNYFLFKLKTLDLIETIETKNDELMRTINETETAQRLHQLENRGLIENAKKDLNRRLDAFAKSHKILTAKLAKVEKLSDRHSQTLQRFLPHCSLARSAKFVTLSNGKNYNFSLPNVGNWSFANESCAKQGLHLATITDSRDAQVVAAQGEKIKPGWGWWVSGKRGSEKDFRWQDGAKLELNSPLWYDEADKSKDCVRIHDWKTKGKLYTFDCTDSFRPFICELPSECYS